MINNTLSNKIKIGDTRTVTSTISDGVQLDDISDGWIHDYDIQLAEDTSKPVTEEYKGNIYEIGQDYLFRNNGSSLTYSKLENIIFSDAYPFKTVNCNYKYIEEVPSSKHLGTITPAPIDLIDGNAYMFDYKCETSCGIYDGGRFYYKAGWTSAANCTNIRRMLVELDP